MSGKKKMPIVIICVILGLILIILVSINFIYPKGSVHKVKFKGNLVYDGIELKIIESEIKEVNDYFSEELQQDIKKTGINAKVIIVKIEAYNTKDIRKKFAPYEFSLTSSSWENGLDSMVFYELNKNKYGLETMIEPLSKTDMYLGYVIYDFQVSKKKWENLKVEDFELVYSAYPSKKPVELKEE